tara:strand:+ start:38 stop:1555 length:1518 start_codon:yes stop_codon:yes gene_type:complete
MEGNVRVRFAPSPTGPLHVGGLRTALFNYLFAKKHNGSFILRIEDTDSKRKVEGAEEYLHRSLEWCGLVPDESVLAGGDYGPYKQSERSKHYKEHVDMLLKNGSAYYAFDSEGAINIHREEHKKKGKTFIYNWHNRLKLKNSLSLSKEEVEGFLNSGKPFVVRFKSPENKQVVTDDVIRGRVVTESRNLDDKVLYKSDGTPTYHLANVVDDHLMKISHVIRGEEWLPSLPLHYMLYDAFGWEKPVFAHLSLILSPSGKGKLSKRSGEREGAPVYPLTWKKEEEIQGYKEVGIISEGLVNYMALLGWSPGSEKEVYTIEGLIEDFGLKGLASAGAKFDYDRLKWFNLRHLQKKSGEELLLLLDNFGYNTKELSKEKSLQVLNAAKERSNTLKDLWGVCRCFYEAPETYDEGGRKKATTKNTAAVLSGLLEMLESLDGEDAEHIREGLELFCEKAAEGKNPIKQREILMPFRIALVGSLSGLDISFIVSVIGIEETGKRLSSFLKTL